MSDAMERFSGKRIAVYGLGQDTRIFLETEGASLDIVCLLDGFRENGTCFGYPVLSLTEAHKQGVDTIVVIARKSSMRVIVHRIASFCFEHGISLTDLSGNNLLAQEERVAEQNDVRYPDREQILRMMDACDVISFDVFDTLLARLVPEPPDLHLLTAHRMRNKLSASLLAAYPKERVRAEQMLSREGVPDIRAIYRRMQEETGMTDEQRELLLQAELETEGVVICRREDVCALFREAVEKKKTVCLTSDMYLPYDAMERLLSAHGISGYHQLLISCEYGVGKRNGLFERLKEFVPGKTVLHIGDDEKADEEAAKAAGLNTVRIPSGAEMMYGYEPVCRLPAGEDLYGKLQTGMLCACLFNSPFALADGAVHVSDPETLGYALYAPLVADFLSWLDGESKKEGIENLLFCARDGYLPEQLFRQLYGEGMKGAAGETMRNAASEGHKMRGIYFLTSRMCALGASIETEADVTAMAKVPFSGTTEDLVRLRFQLDPEELPTDIPAENEAEDRAETLGKLMPAILESARKHRAHYRAYIDSLQLSEGKTGVFDLVSTGSAQALLARITGRELTGFYLMRLAPDTPEKAALTIRSYIDTDADTAAEHPVTEDYFLLESILTAPDPGLRTFAEGGVPQYLPEDRTQEEIDLVMRVQKGITAYVRRYVELLSGTDTRDMGELQGNTNRSDLPEAILHLIHHIAIDLSVFKNMTWSDPYYHRQVRLEEML